VSLFDYPRINFKGTLQLNPGTANNDDYAADFSLPAAWGPFAGAALGLIDSKRVEPRTYGMSDAAFIAWVQKAQTFDCPVDYADTAAGDAKGWLFDFDLSSNRDAQRVLADPNAVFALVHPTIGEVLAETDYYFVTNQQALYAEQFGSGAEFLNDAFDRYVDARERPERPIPSGRRGEPTLPPSGGAVAPPVGPVTRE